MFYTKNDTTIWLDLSYKNRKSIMFIIEYGGNIQIMVPKGTTEQDINLAIENKWDWLIAQRQLQIDQGTSKEKNYTQHETALFLGKSFAVVVRIEEDIKRGEVGIRGETIEIILPVYSEENVKKSLQKFYTKECKKMVDKKIREYTNLIGKPSTISISNSDRSWGTCNTKREVTFHWKLAMAPLEVLEYVVIHELSHLQHMNHDRSFWRLVGKYCPNYETHQQWLSVFQNQMTL